MVLISAANVMMVIGIVGGVASGKSFVAQGLVALGAKNLDADRTGHEVLDESEIKQAIRQRWGDSVFDAHGGVSRTELSKIVFALPPHGAKELAFLEQLTHPRIGQRLQERLAELAAEGTPAVVLDAAVMFEAGWDQFCDQIVFVDAPQPARLARARKRGWDEREFAAREAAQDSLESKRSRAHVVIDNSGPPEDTMQQLRHYWNSLNVEQRQ